jgi:8-oxoguanine deaminase
MPTMVAKNAALVVTMDGQRRELPDAGLYIKDGFIEQVGPTDALPKRADILLDLRGQIVLPGLVNCHHHLDQILTRNIAAGQNVNLFPWLRAHYRLWATRPPRRAPPRSSASASWRSRGARRPSTTPTSSRTGAA